MSERNLSRPHVFHGEVLASCADLMDNIAADPQLSPRKKEARRTALRTLCRGLKSDPKIVTLSQLARAIGTQRASEKASNAGDAEREELDRIFIIDADRHRIRIPTRGLGRRKFPGLGNDHESSRQCLHYPTCRHLSWQQ